MPRHKLTPQEYLDVERQAERKSEFYNGEMFAMSGASEEHEAIKTNVALALGNQLKGRGCRLFTSDMRVKVSPTGLYTYPDIAVVCGERRFEDAHGDTLVNPTLIVEVLSPSTEAYDRGGKFAHYRTIESLSDYVLVAQVWVSVDHYVRRSDGSWQLHAYTKVQDTVQVASLGVTLSLADVYAEMDLPPEPPLHA